LAVFLSGRPNGRDWGEWTAASRQFDSWPTAHDRRGHDEPSVLLTVLNVPLIFVARLLIAEAITTTIKPIKTAYSTAVGPSSLTMNRRAFETKFFILLSFAKESETGG
jgi:hypothetical protein